MNRVLADITLVVLGIVALFHGDMVALLFLILLALVVPRWFGGLS